MKYILGIDTTFHSCGVSLVSEDGKVIVNRKKDIDFFDENAKKFFNFHNSTVLSLLKPILGEYGEKIFLISASSLDGPFHSMPVGAIVANSLSHFLKKGIVGVDHEVAHVHANWLDRREDDFSYPTVCLNVSGAHSNVYLVEKDLSAKKVSEIIWQKNPEKFGGLGALFDVVCGYLKLEIKRGGGGAHLEKLAELGEAIYERELSKMAIEKMSGDYYLENLESAVAETLEKHQYFSLDGEILEKFQKDFSASFLEVLFDLLVSAMGQVVQDFSAKEIHLVGGVALNKNLGSRLQKYCQKNNLDFKVPLDPDYCLDNAAMVAISGYFKWRNTDPKKKSDFLEIIPSEWYLKRYAKLFG